MFTAARVLLKEIVEIDIEETKRHKAALRLYSKHFVNVGAFPSEFGRVLDRSSQIRAAADYSTAFVTANEVCDLIDSMERFIALAERLLAEHKVG